MMLHEIKKILKKRKRQIALKEKIKEINREEEEALEEQKFGKIWKWWNEY